ncbi:DUF1858 domain-containing protein [Candidatus Micrarchaeota archaeon]|nr:DUF1858 domain-containing protein [Candidatus Micrarchaeota archaeon]
MERITTEMPINDLLAKHPSAVRVFLAHGLHCFGCAAAVSENIGQGAKAHGLSDEQVAKLIDEINEVVEEDEKAGQ